MWVGNRGTVFDNGELSEKRIELLNEIEFVWDPFDARWNEMFERLVEYKKKNGSTNVPKRYKEDPELATWVYDQRRYRREESLPMKRIEKLDSIGFVWRIQ